MNAGVSARLGAHSKRFIAQTSRQDRSQSTIIEDHSNPTWPNMRNPTFSIIMPTYNRATTIKKVVDSILNQSYADFELIIIDDGSTDETWSILNDIDDTRIQLIQQKNTLQTLARRRACNLAKGKYLAFCDSDDIWSLSHLRIILDVFEGYDASYVFTNYRVQGEITPRIDLNILEIQNWLRKFSRRENDFLYSFNDLYGALLEYQPIFCSCQAITRSHYEFIGGISERINNRELGTRITSEDSHIIRRSAITDRAYFLNITSVQLGRQGDNTSKSYTSNLQGGLKILLDILENSNLSRAHHQLTKRAVRQHRRELAKQIYYYEPATTFRKHFLSQPKFELDIKNHLHFILSFFNR